MRAFMKAVEEYGLPRRVRSDKGSENVLVAEYMFQQRSTESRPFIAGRSVHNQRLKHLSYLLCIQIDLWYFYVPDCPHVIIYQSILLDSQVNFNSIVFFK